MQQLKESDLKERAKFEEERKERKPRFTKEVIILQLMLK